MSGIWGEVDDCDTCGDGLRPWSGTTPNSLEEEHPMDVGNREGVIGAGATGINRRRVPTRFGLGQLADDEAPAIDANPGAPGSDAGGDSGSDNPAVNTSINPTAATTAGAQTGTSPGGSTSSGGGNGGSDITADDSGPDYVPWVIGGALVLAAGVGAAVYLKRRRR